MPETVERKPPEALAMNRRKNAEFERQVHRVYPELGTLPTDLLRRDYWAHMGREFRPMDKIEACADDGTWYAEYLVLGCDRLWAKVILILSINLSTADVAQTQADDKLAPENFTVKWSGPLKKWCVLDKPKAPGQAPGYLKEGCQSKAEAEEWRNGHIKTTA